MIKVVQCDYHLLKTENMMFKIKSMMMLVTIILSTAISGLVFAANIPEMSQAQLIQHLSTAPTEVIVLDVRSKKEFDLGHIKGAINISYDRIKENLTKLTQYKDKTMVVYCRSGRRAGVAETILAENGFNKVRHLTGDMNAWQAAELPTVTSH